MERDAWVLVAISVVALILLAIGGYHLLRFLRGSIKIRIPKTAYAPGEMVAGSLELKAKRPIDAHRLVCRLLCKEITTTTRHDGGNRGSRTRSRSREVYRDEITLSEETSYAAGHTSTHEFSIQLPGSAAPVFGGAEPGGAMGTVLEVLSNRRTRLQWEVSARLECKGVDLAARRRLSVRE